MVENRLVDLEIRVTFQEKTIEELNEVIIDQQNQIDLLARELERVREQLRTPPTPGPVPDPLPPHY